VYSIIQLKSSNIDYYLARQLIFQCSQDVIAVIRAVAEMVRNDIRGAKGLENRLASYYLDFRPGGDSGFGNSLPQMIGSAGMPGGAVSPDSVKIAARIDSLPAIPSGPHSRVDKRILMDWKRR
jgi:hypothetical protein